MSKKSCIDCIHWDADVDGFCLNVEAAKRFDSLIREMCATGRDDELSAEMCVGFEKDNEDEANV